MPDYGYSKDALRAIVGLVGEFVGTTDVLTETNKTLRLEDNIITSTTPALGDLLVGNATKYIVLPRGAANLPLKVNSAGTNLDYGTLPVAGGGTGAATLTGILKGTGTTAVIAVAAPTGALVGDDDVQNISNKTYVNPLFSTTQSGLTWLKTTAGDFGIDFGSGHTSGGSAFWDFHIISTDGDYSTRIIRNSGANGTFQFIQTGTGSFTFNAPFTMTRGTINTATNQNYPIITQTIGTTDTTAFNLPGFQVATDITCTTPTDPFDLVYTGDYSLINYGPGPVAAKGSALASCANIVVTGSGSVNNELANYFAVNRAENAAQVSHWMTDWNIHGPIAAQPGMLSGVNMLVNNYYNGSPSRNSSGCVSAQTRPGTGGGGTAAHTAATTYKLDYGITVQGIAGTTGLPTRGFEIALLVGGGGSPWQGPGVSSKIGTGLKLIDIESVGIDLNDPATSATTPAAIKVTTVTRTWDTFIDLSSGLAPTTAAIKLGANPIVGTTLKVYEVAANVLDLTAISNTFSLLRLMPNSSTVASTAGRGLLRIMNTSSGANTEYIEIGAYGTDGYKITSSPVSGSGALRPINIQMGAANIITFSIDNTVDFNSRTISNQITKFRDVTKINTDSPYSILTTDDIIRVDATSGAVILTLPTAVGATGQTYRIRRVDIIASTNLVKVATTSSQTIGLAPSWYLWPSEFLTVESDGANWQVLGCANPSPVGHYFNKGNTTFRRVVAGDGFYSNLITSTTSPAANILWALPLLVSKVTKFSNITFVVSTGAATNARCGIYRDNGNGYPGALIFDTGSVDCTAAATKDTAITAGLQVFPPGLYWLAWEVAAATIQIRSLGTVPGTLEILGHGNTMSANPSSYGYSVAHTYGALPDPYTAAASILTTVPSFASPVPAIGLSQL